MSLRLRLTALHAGVFVVASGALLAVSYWLIGRHLRRTVSDAAADSVLHELAGQYLLGLVGMALIALALGWLAAGRALAPLRDIARTAGRVSDESLGERVEPTGPRDEVRQVADAFDAMLDRLEESVDAQRRFVANASHELRRPLSVIRAEADVTLADPGASAAELRAMGQAVLEATDRTDALLDGLLVLARSRRGGLARDPVDLALVTQRAAAAVARDAAARAITVHVRASRALAAGDEALLDRLVSNLLENAVRHNVHGGRADIEVGADGADALLVVRNTGPRLEAGDIDRLCEPFERLGSRSGGAGLGLSIVRAVAEAHGGNLVLRAQEGGGLEALVRLPATARSSGAPGPGAAPAA